MQRLEVSCAVRRIYTSLGAIGLKPYSSKSGERGNHSFGRDLLSYVDNTNIKETKKIICRGKPGGLRGL